MSDIGIFVCKYCGIRGHSLLAMALCPKNQVTRNHVVIPDKKRYTCKYCGVTFSNSMTLMGFCPNSPHKTHELPE